MAVPSLFWRLKCALAEAANGCLSVLADCVGFSGRLASTSAQRPTELQSLPPSCILLACLQYSLAAAAGLLLCSPVSLASRSSFTVCVGCPHLTCHALGWSSSCSLGTCPAWACSALPRAPAAPAWSPWRPGRGSCRRARARTSCMRPWRGRARCLSRRTAVCLPHVLGRHASALQTHSPGRASASCSARLSARLGKGERCAPRVRPPGSSVRVFMSGRKISACAACAVHQRLLLISGSLSIFGHGSRQSIPV